MLSPEAQARIDKVLKLGLKYDGQQLTYHDINFHWTDIVCMTEAEFKKAYDGAVKRKAAIDSGHENPFQKE
jgi:hypothetical protein